MLVIHGAPVSIHARKVIVVALIKGLDHRVEPVIPFTPPPGWAELSPTGLIPVMEDDGFALPDSTAISLYLEKRYPTPAVLPADPQAYGRSLWFDAYAGGMVYRHALNGLFGQLVARPRILGQPTEQAVVDDILTTIVPKLFDYLESQAGAPFLAGDRLSLGDIAVASNLINFNYLGLRIDTVAYPRLAAFLARVLEQPAVKAALAAEAPFAERLGLDRSFLD